MPKNKEIESFNIREVRFIECCDCGLVHEVYYDIYENSIDIVYSRDEGRTIKRRAEMKLDGQSKKKSPSELLAEDMLKNPLTPPSNVNFNLKNFVTLGNVMTEKVMKNVRPEQNTDSRKKSPY